MSRATSYYYMILKLANPTPLVLDSGLNVDDLLEAADAYNARFKGLKQIMLLKTDGVKIHIMLSLAELSSVTVKRTHSDFSPHIAVFGNYLLNEKMWSQYSQDYRRLLHIYNEPQKCSREEVAGVLDALGYSEEAANQAAQTMQIVGPSEQVLLRWYLHIQLCLQTAPHLAFENGQAQQSEQVPQSEQVTERPRSARNGAAVTSVSGGTPAHHAHQPDESAEPDALHRQPTQSTTRVNQPMRKQVAAYTATAQMIRNQYRQVAAESKLTAANEEPADVPGTQEQPSEPDKVRQIVTQIDLFDDTEQAESDQPDDVPVDTMDLVDPVDPLDPLDRSDELEWPQSVSTDTFFTSSMNDEQLMAVLHSMVLTQDIGDARAIARKKATINTIKQLISPWATFG